MNTNNHVIVDMPFYIDQVLVSPSEFDIPCRATVLSKRMIGDTTLSILVLSDNDHQQQWVHPSWVWVRDQHVLPSHSNHHPFRRDETMMEKIEQPEADFPDNENPWRLQKKMVDCLNLDD